MEKKLTYRFINPNSEEATVEAVLKILIESKKHIAEEAIKKVINKTSENKRTA